MASYVFYPGDGVQTVWSVPFPYLDKAHVNVLVNGSAATFSWASPSTITVTPAVASGSTLLIQRVTQDAPMTTFVNTHNLTADNLTLAELQALYKAQEANDRANQSIAVSLATGQYDFGGRRTTNAADPVNDQDLATKHYVDTGATSQVVQATAQANNAAASAAAAATSATSAAAHDTSAGTHETNAGTHETNAAASAAASSTSATNAANSATAAANSATAAGTQASNAASSAAAAASSATSAQNAAAQLHGVSSTGSLTIGLGAVTFPVPAGMAFTVGEWIVANSAADPVNIWMHGQITSYSGTSLGVNVDVVAGSGTHADWTINVSGPKGPAGSGAGDMLSTNNLSDVANAGTARNNLGLGSAALLAVGVAANNVVQLNGSAQLPAVDGSLLSGISRGLITGLTLAYAGTTAIDVAPGMCMSDDGTTLMVLPAHMNKSTIAAWTAGSGGAHGALDGGTFNFPAWYHVFLIKRMDTGACDVLYSQSLNPTPPAPYTKKRRIGSYFNSSVSSGTVRSFVQLADEFLWSTPVGDVSAYDLSTASTLFTLSVPTGLQVRAIFDFAVSNSAGGIALTLTSPDQTASAANTPSGNLAAFTNAAGHTAAGRIGIRTNTSGQVRAVSNTPPGGNTFYIVTHGWIDTRGKDL